MSFNHLKEKTKSAVMAGKPNIFFAHIPKTGGTSVNHAISQHYDRGIFRSTYQVDSISSYKAAEVLYGENSDDINEDHISIVREHLLANEMAKGTKYIVGHVTFNSNIWDAFHHKYIHVTFLRHPVKRYLSHYFYNSFKESSHRRINEDLQTFISTERGRRLGNIYARFLGEQENSEDYRSVTSLDRAKANLCKFRVVGFLEHLNIFVDQFKQETGLTLRIPHKRKNPVSSPEIDKVLATKISEICEPDMSLYEYAINKFANKANV